MIAQEMIVPEKTKPAHLQMSYENFLQWVDEGTHAEWVDGEVIIFRTAKNIHQNTLEFLYEVMALFVRLFQLGKVRIAPFAMKLRAGRSYREPDILFISQSALSMLIEERLEGPADLVIEIVSDDSVQRDREDKFKEYRQADILDPFLAFGEMAGLPDDFVQQFRQRAQAGLMGKDGG